MQEPHRRVVLFYKYFIAESSALKSLTANFVEEIKNFIQNVCGELHMKGRVLIAQEGINGTLSASSQKCMDQFIEMMDSYTCRVQGLQQEVQIFHRIDWKFSDVQDDLVNRNQRPFPDLKISIVKEIVSTGNAVQLDDIPEYGGTHLSPQEFHQLLVENENSAIKSGESDNVDHDSSRKELVLIDIRNTFEHAIGHFKHNEKPAMNPNMVTFSSFDTQFCEENKEYLKDKKVLMYCTGGIRCEKASAMLRKRGVDDVNQLKGGIHRYLEQYPNGFFHGRNFVFDQRVALPSGKMDDTGNVPVTVIVGKCIECQSPYDEISGSRVCTVCRDLVLVCEQCVTQLREYHCERHAGWKTCFFTFLEPFNKDELNEQIPGLISIRDNLKDSKNTRRTLMRQITKVQKRIKELDECKSFTEKNSPRRCRTCHETENVCDGLCWGFWKQAANADRSCLGEQEQDRVPTKVPAKGNRVTPGPDWNEIRFGKKELFTAGIILEVKSWNSGGEVDDCLLVAWEQNDSEGSNNNCRQTNIYRYGALDKSGVRRYDLSLIV